MNGTTITEVGLANDRHLLQHHQQTYHHSEEGSTFNESGGQDHVGAQIVHGFGLTGHGLHSVTADTANAYTCTECGQASTQSSNTITNAEIEENSEEHVFEVYERFKF